MTRRQKFQVTVLASDGQSSTKTKKELAFELRHWQPRIKTLRPSAKHGGPKGSAFERKICRALSRWISGGKHEDLFWRTAMSGGRATLGKRKGLDIRQAGDICSVAPQGHAFTDLWFVECKCVRDLNFTSFLVNNKGLLAGFWKTACRQAKAHHRNPMLIVKENHCPILVITPHQYPPRGTPMIELLGKCDIMLFDEMVQGRPWIGR